jgi:hypothetical protein
MQRMRSLIAIATLAFTACDAEDASRRAIVVRDSSGVAIVDNDLTRLDRICSLATEPRVSIGVLEGEEPYILSQLGGAVRLRDGRIVLANRGTDQIRYYDANGTFLSAAGRQGEGPGEFREPFYLFPVAGDSLYVGDFRPFRFLVFGPDGKWVRTASLDPMEINTPRTMNVLADGRPVLGFDGFPTEPRHTFPLRTMSLRVYGPEGRVLDALGEYPNGRSGQTKPGPGRFFVTSPLFESYSQIRARGDRIVVGHGSRTELVLHRATAGYPVVGIVRWDVGDLTVTAADIDAERARIAARLDSMPPSQRSMMEMMRDEELSPERPVADRFPAFGLLRIATDDAIWIREYPRPNDTATTHGWIAFESDGRFRCRMRTPRFAEFFEFGADYLLVQEPDDEGAERVRLYPITLR